MKQQNTKCPTVTTDSKSTSNNSKTSWATFDLQITINYKITQKPINYSVSVFQMAQEYA